MNPMFRAAVAVAAGVGLACVTALSQSSSGAPAQDLSTPVGVHRAGGDVTAPELLPASVEGTIAPGCEGSIAGKVVLSAIVDASGRARNIMFIHPLGDALDKLELTLLAAERFKPGERDGAPVAVGLSVEIKLEGCFTSAGNGTNKDLKRLRLRSQPQLKLGAYPDYPSEVVLTPVTPQKDAKVYRVGCRVSPPVPMVAPEPWVSGEARKAKYQGQSMVTILVDDEGMPQNPKVVRPLGMGLDEKALDTIVRYRFKAAMLNGRQPVPVLITIAINLRLY
jgi:TonB family protein